MIIGWRKNVNSQSICLPLISLECLFAGQYGLTHEMLSHYLDGWRYFHSILMQLQYLPRFDVYNKMKWIPQAKPEPI